MSETVIQTIFDPPLGWLIINRPEKLNAISAAMWRDIPVKLKTLEDDPAVRVIIIRGAGNRAFSAGADIAEFGQKSASDGPGSREDTGIAFQAIAQSAKPTVAMIHGVCMGGGCAIALSADIRLAAADARFAITPARIGLGYSLAGIDRAVEELGPANARYLLITAIEVSAAKALDIGLVQEVHPAAALESATLALATRIAENAPKTIRAVRESVRECRRDVASRDIDSIRQLIQDCFESDDYREGLRAFAEKRTPHFEDR